MLCEVLEGTKTPYPELEDLLVFFCWKTFISVRQVFKLL